MRGLGEFQKMITKPWWWRKRWKSGRSVTLQSFKVFEILLWKFLYIRGYSWGCGRLLLRICQNDFWFCRILTARLVSKKVWRHCLYEHCRTFAWFSQKLQWFNKNYQLSIYFIWSLCLRSKTLHIQKMKSDWREVLSVHFRDSIKCWVKLEELQKVIPYHSEKYKQIILNSSSPFVSISAHDLSFAAMFVVAVLFHMVKVLTVQMVELISENGITNRTIFKIKKSNNLIR